MASSENKKSWRPKFMKSRKKRHAHHDPPNDVEMPLVFPNVFEFETSELLEYRDESGRNFLVLAAQEGLTDEVKHLLSAGLDPESSQEGKSAASLAYEAAHYDTLLALLENNAKFPPNFNADTTDHEKVIKFAQMMRTFHTIVKTAPTFTEDDLHFFTELFPSLRYFYSPDEDSFNCSALLVAVRLAKTNICKMLRDHGISESPDETNKVQDFTETITHMSANLVAFLTSDAANEGMLADMLCVKSFFGGDLDESQRRESYKKAKLMFEFLAGKEKIKPLLIFLTTLDDLKIIFDFEREKVHVASKSERFIFIGAKELNDGIELERIYGKMVRELCRFVVRKLLKRSRTLSVKLTEVKLECFDNRFADPLINDVFVNNRIESKKIELVSIVPQLLVKYPAESEALDDKRKRFVKLFTFYEKHVVEESKENISETVKDITNYIEKINKRERNDVNATVRIMNTRHKWKIRGAILLLILLIFLLVALILTKSPEEEEAIVRNFSCGEVRARIKVGKAYIMGLGANETYKGQWPWLGALFIEVSAKQNVFGCGSSLITKWHVLTAAHCVPPEHQDPEKYFVLLGHHNISDDSEIETQKRYMSHLYVHEEYNSERESYKSTGDIAVLRMKESILFNDFIQPVCLPPPNTIVDGTSGYVAGYGKFSVSAPHADTPKYVQLLSKSNTECIFHQSDQYHHIVSRKSFCAGESTATPCSGDSGSGFYVPSLTNGSEQFVVTGIVSQGLDAFICDPNDYVVFVNVVDYRAWIIEKVAICGENEACVDPCGLSPCGPGEICFTDENNTFICSKT